MATIGFTSSPDRPPPSIPLSTPPVDEYSEYFDLHSEQKENSPKRKPLPDIPLPMSGRIQGAPMSPVKINVQSEYPVRPSSANIENHYPVRQVGTPVSNESQRRDCFPSSGSGFNFSPSPSMDTQRISEGKLPDVRSASSMGIGKAVTSSEDFDLHNDLATIDLKASDESADEPLPYHHQTSQAHDTVSRVKDNRSPGTYGQLVNRNLTPASQSGRGSAAPRPNSTYSAWSGEYTRGRSFAPNKHLSCLRPYPAGRSPSGRPQTSYIDLLNTPYAEQQAPPPISFDNSDLRGVIGTNASLLSTQKTLEMYRMNVKKTNDSSIQYAFALFLIQAAREIGANEGSITSKKTRQKSKGDRDSPHVVESQSSGPELLHEAKQILTQLADRSYPFAQYYLADGYFSGLFSKGKEDYGRAFPLFVAASKHGHAESGYRAALCYEFGWGCRKDAAKAVQFYRQSASKNHPGSMTRLGRACLSGDLGLNKYREGLKWLKRATEAADIQYNAAPFHLGILYETGYGDDVFKDESYAAQLFTQAADLGHIEASYRLGDAYEHGRLSCPRDPALSVHFYTNAAQGGHAKAMMALCAWYMVGAEPILEKDEDEAYEWARRAAELGMFDRRK